MDKNVQTRTYTIDTQQDIRWLQRFSNFRKALTKLYQAAKIIKEKMDFEDEVDELLEEGLIQRFEYTHELAWKVMKDYAEYQGYTNIRGSRDAIRQALAINIIDDKQWMESIVDRNLTSHHYDNDTATRIHEKIVDIYLPLLCRFEKKMIKISGTDLNLFDE
ncbi:MAG: nucleotidyltransferase substrate binding protein [Bacteroidales bacterium]|nr:nucleotidyltransferase substrate binding protein [Bacteroidales bacterium]MCL2132766.1 nucleotidyltransferase substrate binding protein [Bacteroidales bacterium]